MNDVMSAGLAMAAAIAAAGVISFACWGVSPLVRKRSQSQVRRKERVSFSSDVNTDLRGYTAATNRWGWLTGGVCAVLWVWMTVWHPILLGLGGMVLGVMAGRFSYRKRQWESIQSFWLTDRGVWCWPAREGRPFWKGKHVTFGAWKSFDGYKIDGGYVNYYRGDEQVLQVEYTARDYEPLKAALARHGVKRIELSDRIWVAQFDEAAFYRLEEEISMTGWNLLELFQDELIEHNLMPEFGVMRNMPGNRLLDEHSRSWLQLNLLDIDTEERKASSVFPLWQSSGTVGYLIGMRGQELYEPMQRWMRQVLAEAVRLEEVVS